MIKIKRTGFPLGSRLNANNYLLREMIAERNRFWKNAYIAISLVSVLWFIFFIQAYGFFDFAEYGNWPRHREGLIGIVFSPFLHGSFEHLVSNTLPFLVLLTVLLNAYPRVALFTLVFIHLISGALVWLFAPDTGIHIGISGIIYGLAFFLIASGIFRKDRTAFGIAILVTVIYIVFGEMLVGFIPKTGVSWQSHLFGALSGVLVAFLVRKIDVPPPHEFELEKVEDEKHFFDKEN